MDLKAKREKAAWPSVYNFPGNFLGEPPGERET
jgi:hypothetical protein